MLFILVFGSLSFYIFKTTAPNEINVSVEQEESEYDTTENASVSEPEEDDDLWLKNLVEIEFPSFLLEKHQYKFKQDCENENVYPTGIYFIMGNTVGDGKTLEKNTVYVAGNDFDGFWPRHRIFMNEKTKTIYFSSGDSSASKYGKPTDETLSPYGIRFSNEGLFFETYKESVTDTLYYKTWDMYKTTCTDFVYNYNESDFVKKVTYERPDGRISFEESKDFMVKQSRNTNQKLIKSFVSNFDGKDIYMFFTLSTDRPGYSCVSLMTPFNLEILSTDCNLNEVKVSEWNNIPGSPKIYL